MQEDTKSMKYGQYRLTEMNSAGGDGYYRRKQSIVIPD